MLHHPLLRPVFVTQFIFNIGSFLLLAVFVPYAVRHLGLSATGVGTTLAMYGVGMVVGALLATRVMRRLAFGTVIGLGPVTGFVAAAVMALTTSFPRPWLAGLSFFLLGVGPILWVISTTTLRQSVTPPRLLGPRLRDQYHELWRTPARLGARRHRRRALRRRSLPLSRGRDLRRAGAGDPDVARGLAGAAAGDGLRARAGLVGRALGASANPCPLSVIPGRRASAIPVPLTTIGSMDSGLAPRARPGMRKQFSFPISFYMIYVIST